LVDLYTEPRARPERPHYAWLQNQCKFFHEHHRTDRWNLRDPLDAFQLYYSIESLGFRSFELAILCDRTGRYKEGHYYYGYYDFARVMTNTLFPWKDDNWDDVSDRYHKVQMRVQDIERILEAAQKQRATAIL
ncbi:MAG: hypothetical protein WC455_31110, partial [Dehalococcoidia bacterium]|jgi:hypothetical protein